MSPLSAIHHTLPQTALLPAPGVETSFPADAVSTAGAATPASGGFSSLLGQMVQDVNASQSAAASAVSGLQNGGQVPLHQAVIAMEEANVSFQLMVEVRNKLLESYQEIMRMQI